METKTTKKVIPGGTKSPEDQNPAEHYNTISIDWNRRKYTTFFSYIQRKGEKRDGCPKSIGEIIDQNFSNLFSDGNK